MNKEILVENLQQKLLISQRMVFDYITVKHASSLHEYTIPNSLTLNVKVHMPNMFNFKSNRKKQVKMLKSLLSGL